MSSVMTFYRRVAQDVLRDAKARHSSLFEARGDVELNPRLFAVDVRSRSSRRAQTTKLLS